MKKIFFAACCSVLMITLMGFVQQPQQQGQKINIQIPHVGFPVSVQTLSPQAFPPAFFLFIAMDIKNRVAPAGVEIELKGKDFLEKFNLTERGAQKQFPNMPQDSVEIKITKEGYKTIKGKVLLKGPATVGIRLDKVE